MEEKKQETSIEKDEQIEETNETEAVENDEVAEKIETDNEEAIDEHEQLKRDFEELNERFLRVHADYDNFRRRTREEKEAAAKYRAQHLVEGILPVLDNFERALLVQAESEETKSVLQGMDMIYRQLLEVLKSEGVTVIEAVGQQFDPHLHQAVMQVEEEGYESNIVVEELQKGYKLHDRVIRASMVKVNV